MGKYSMYVPYGYVEEMDYESSKSMIDKELEQNRENDEQEFADIASLQDSVNGELFANSQYDTTLKSLVFFNKQNEAVASVDMSGIVAHDLIKEAYYDKDTKTIVIVFDNDDRVTIDANDLIDILEAGDGLEVDADGNLKIKVNASTEPYVSVSADGLKLEGINNAIEAAVNEEASRAQSEEVTLDGKIADEKTRAEGEEVILAQLIAGEKNRAESVEASLQEQITAESGRASEEEARIEAKFDEITSSLSIDIADEQARAEGVETVLTDNLAAEVSRATAKEADIESGLTNEITRAQQAEVGLDEAITAERDRAEGVETVLIENLDELKESVKTDYFAGAEYSSTNKKIYFTNGSGNVITEIDASDFVKDGMIDDVKVEDGNLVIVFNTDSGKETISIPLTEIFNPDNYYTKEEVDEKDGVVDAKIDSTAEAIRGEYAEADAALDGRIDGLNTKVDNAVSGLEVEISAVDAKFADVYTKEEADATFLKEHQDISDLATKEEVAAADNVVLNDVLNRIWSNKNHDSGATGTFSTKKTNANGSYALLFNESDGGGAQYFNAGENIISYVGVNDGGANDVCVQIYSKNKGTNVGSRLNVNPNGMFYAVSSSASLEPSREVAVKEDVDTSKAELQAELEEKQATINSLTSELYDLKKIVGNMGGSVTYEYPGIEGKPLTTILGNNGTVKLVEDAETGRYAQGMMASNHTTLNLNGNDWTVSGAAGTTDAAMLVRGTQQITIKGNGTFEYTADAALVWAASTGCTVSLEGSNTNTYYVGNSPTGELIYCELGTIYIKNGIFKNGGSPYLLNCKDENYAAGTANIIVSSTSTTTGPSFYDFNPGDNSAEGPHTSFVAEGCHVISKVVTEEDGEHTVYTVVKD